MKQVVINGGETYGDLLTPKWTNEYLKRKRIECFVYGFDFKDSEETAFKLLNPEELNDPTATYFIFYSRTFIEDSKKMVYEDEINIRELFKNREDKDLINIAKEINNESLIKIIDIPDDVEYDICTWNCGFGEYIAEKYRIWD